MAMNEQNEIRFGQNGEQLIHHDAANKELKHPLRKKLRAWQTDCDSEEQVVTLLNRSQPQNETTDNTERILPASVTRTTPSPSGAPNVVKRKPRLEPTARRRFRQQRGP
jgi:hypothetical protein